MNDHPFQIQLTPEIKRIFHLYYQMHGIRLSLFTPQGDKIYPREDQPDCSYCRLIRNDLDFEERCLKLDRRMIRLCIEEDRLIRYHCHGGMEEAALPLRVDGDILGCIMLGQFRRKSAGESPYSGIWRERFGNSRLVEAYEETPEFSDRKIPVLMDIYQTLLDILSRERMIRHRDFDLILPITRRLEEEPRWNPSLSEAAKAVGRSTSSTTRLFKKITGKSFKNYLVELKMNQAERIMIDFPRKPVKEIAWELGYGDPLYFSRLFKKQLNLSPRELREKRLQESERFFQSRWPG